MNKRVSLIIPTVWAANDYLIESIYRLNKNQFVGEIILIDNLEKDAPVWINDFEKLKRVIPEYSLYFNPSVNMGVDLCKNELCCVLNDDAVIDVDVFEFLLNNVSEDMGCVFIDPRSINGNGVPETHIFNKKTFPSKRELIPYNKLFNHGPGMFFCFFKNNFIEIPEKIKHHLGDTFMFKQNEFNGRKNYMVSGYELKIPLLGSASSKKIDTKKRTDLDWSFYDEVFNDTSNYTKKYKNKIDKKYTWCFAGQVHAQGDRSKMIESLKKCNGEYHLHIAEGWRSEDSLSTQEYKNILSESIFVPCPRGNTSVDTFRLYEALEVGAIPIVEKDDYWHNLLGEHPLIETGSWNNISNDINLLLENSQWIIGHSKKVQSWWIEYKKQLKQNIAKIVVAKSEPPQEKEVDPRKHQEFLRLKDEWSNLVDRDYLKYISKHLNQIQVPKEKFTTYNPGKKIAIVSLYTPEIADYAICSEMSVRDYCLKQGYTFYVYREKLQDDASANWSKARAILNHFDDHEDIVWMDSDTVIYNSEKRFEDILDKCSSTKKIIACEDVGNNSMLNSGVLIFRNHNYTKNIIKKWMEFKGDKSSLYASGGDQEILCKILKSSDGFGFNRKIFPMNKFNTDPRMIDDDTFILHFMAYTYELKKIFMRYFVSS